LSFTANESFIFTIWQYNRTQ